jgi:hypothetical protein
VDCASCGERNPERARFCLNCGRPLQRRPERPAPSVRKVVTVVFSDLTGSTALGERLDPEALSQVMGRWYAAAQRELARHGGTVQKFAGDAVMAVFGIPSAHEDDALRAVRAAVGLHSGLERLNDELEADWGVRLALHTGAGRRPRARRRARGRRHRQRRRPAGAGRRAWQHPARACHLDAGARRGRGRARPAHGPARAGAR